MARRKESRRMAKGFGDPKDIHNIFDSVQVRSLPWSHVPRSSQAEKKPTLMVDFFVTL